MTKGFFQLDTGLDESFFVEALTSMLAAHFCREDDGVPLFDDSDFFKFRGAKS